MGIQSKLSRFDLIMIVVSLVIGIGIFKTPAIVAEKAGTPFIFYSAWILAGVISIFGALTYAEIGARLPVAGGFYKIFSHCYHPAFAFMLNWSIVITNAGSAAAVALVGAEYIQPILVPAQYQAAISPKTIALAIISLLFVLNFIGIKMGSRVQNILSSVKIAMILLFCLSVFGIHQAPSSLPLPEKSTMDSFRALGLCLVSVFFTYGGYHMTINMGADVKSPQRNIPLAIFIGIAIIIVLYLLINFAYCQVLGFENLSGKTLIAAELAKKFLGEPGFKITSLAVFFSVLGYVNTSMIFIPRIYYAMAGDRILPPVFKQVNPRTQVQEFALSFFFGIMLISLFLLRSFEKLMNYTMFIDCMSLIFGAATIFILRKRMANFSYAGYRMKLFPLFPVLFMIVLVAVCISILASDTTAAAIGSGIFILGYPLYRIFFWLNRKNAKTE